MSRGRLNVSSLVILTLGLVICSCSAYNGDYYNSLFRPLSAHFKTKVETLGAMLKRHVQQLRATENRQIELVFLVDSSSSVGSEKFFDELRFVRKLLADFTVDINTTRVSVITFSSRGKVIRHVDHLTRPNGDHHKCGLLEEELPRIRYIGGGTYTLGAFLEAKAVLKGARPDAAKAIFLITDGFSNGGDPRPEARALRGNGVKIFTFGIRNGNFRELFDMASEPKNETCYILDSFEEFEALARRALHEDLRSGTYVTQPKQRCNKLCNSKSGSCCHVNATCACGTHTGKYECLCQPGFYGHGLGEKGCKPCPSGTYKNFSGPGDINTCISCPDEHQTTGSGTMSLQECSCKRGYVNLSSSECAAFTCPALHPPENGYFVNNKCNNVFNAACGLRCTPGYELHGSSLRICQEDGSWSGVATECVMKTCPPLPKPKDGHMICSHDDFTYATECRFTCNTGYKLVGSRKRTCLAIAYWTGITTRCREITCQALAKLRDGSIHPAVCTEGEVSFGTTCQMSCAPGYKLHGPHTKQCTPDGNWAPANGRSSQCIDENPPYVQCPKNIEAEADEDDSTAEVKWQVPVPVDNSGFIPTLKTEPAVSPPSRFPIGKTHITYIAEDLSKNKARCKFYITVQDTTPPTVDRCYSPLPLVSPDQYGNVTWEEPLFTDNSDDEIKIEKSHKPGWFPRGNTKVTYTAFDKSGNNNTCTLEISVIPHPCEFPLPPVNGNRTCFEQEEAVICTISCQPGYAFAIPPVEEYRCAYNNIWEPQENMPFPDCSAKAISNGAVQPATLTFTGQVSCRQRKTLNSIKENFQKKVSIRVNDLCDDNINCSIEDIETTCEEEDDFNQVKVVLGKRRKRSTHFKTRKIATIGTGRQKKTLVTFDFVLEGSVLTTGNQLEDSRRQKAMTKNLKKILHTLRKEAESGNLDLFFIGKQMNFRNMTFDPYHPNFICPEGTILIDSTCVNCPVGTYFNVIHEKCESCPFGTYQPIEGKLTCLVCPGNRSTIHMNAKSSLECKAQCLPGSFSSNGLERCETCKIGFYQPEYAQTECLQCPGNMTTRRRGSRLETKCKERCKPGHVSKTGLEPCFPCLLGSYQPDAGQSSCYECPNQGSTKDYGSTSLSDCEGDWDLQGDIDVQNQQQRQVDDCFRKPCLNGGICIPRAYGYTCKCPPGYDGVICHTVVDQCKAKPCLNNGTCVSQLVDYKCRCVTGFEGKKCEINVNECESYPCWNDGTCIDGANSFRCSCQSGFQGATCAENTDECLGEPCRNGGTCIDGVSSYKCQCYSGFTGETCEIDIDECLADPCSNNGTCTDDGIGFRCRCEPGYTGTGCEEDINECDSTPCLNGAKCEDILNGYICHCKPDFKGKHCDLPLDTNFQLDFAAPGTVDHARLPIKKDLSAVTISFWMKSDDILNYGTPFSYAVGVDDNALTLTDYSGFTIYVNQERVVTDVEANDGFWHHVVVTWSSNRGSWKMYIDGLLNDSGFDLSTGKPIPGGGILVVGQEQDSVGGGFTSSEAFVGSLTHLNLWDEELPLKTIDAMRTSCKAFRGNVVAWPDVVSGLRGTIKDSPSTFCEGICC